MRWGGVAIVIALVLGMIEGYIHIRIKDGVQSELEHQMLKKQNEEIAKKALDTKKYISTQKEQTQKSIIKYKTIYTKDTSCEGKLKEIGNAMDLYFDSFGS